MNKGVVLWFTGLPGSGKSTIAGRLFEHLQSTSIPCEWLDGDVLRQRFSTRGFSKRSRGKHIDRVGFMANLLSRNGVVVLVSLISPYRQHRDSVRRQIENFVEIYVNAPLAVCEARDPKGMYKKARAGQIKKFTGIDDPYEPPKHPELELRTDQLSLNQCVTKILNYLNGY